MQRKIHVATLLCVFVASCNALFASRLILGGNRENVNSQFNFSIPKPPLFGGSFFPSVSKDDCSKCVCGVGRQIRIVNGQVTNTHEFPWAVAITYQGMHHCGASLITSRHILTAAHCIYGFQKKFFGVRLADKAKYKIKSMTVHEEYDRNSFNNDIAVIELDRPVPLDGNVKTVCLPNEERFSYIGETGVAIGWGRLGEGAALSSELRKVDLPVMSEEECLRSKYPNNRVTENMFCAGYLSGERDSCNGDSGGAFHVRNPNGAMDVIGLVSFGRGCARPNFPGVYTKVTNYLGWIDRQINGQCKCSPPADSSR